MTQTLKWGILSTARITRRIIPVLQQAKRSELLAVASRKLETAADFAQAQNIPLHFGSYEALLALPEINAIYIPLPNSLHAEWAIKAAKAGKHILCEKPLALSVTAVDAMREAADKNGVVLIEALMYQMHPQFETLQQVLQEGLIGQIKLIKTHFSFKLPVGVKNIRLDRTLGGGSLWDVGSYVVSFANGLAGEPPSTVFANFETDENGVEVLFAAQMRYASGIIAQFDCGFQIPYRIGAEVIGDQGVIRLPQPWQPNVDHRGSGLLHIALDDTETLIPTPKINPYLSQIQVLEQAALDGKTPPFSVDQSRININTITRLYEAAAQ